MSSLHFDPCQFAARRSRPVDAEYTSEGWTSTGLAFEDYERMSSRASSVPLRHRRWTPAFAASDEKLRRVLLHRAWMYVHGAKAISTPADYKAIDAAATKKALELSKVHFINCPAHKRAENDAHMAAVRKAGSYLALQNAIAYRAWRLGQDSVAIGESLGMSPQAIRVNIQRLCNAARDLDYETFPRHHSLGKPRGTSTIILTGKMDVSSRIITLYKTGKNVSQIAQAIGYPKGHGNNRVRDALIKAGIYKGRQRRVN
jgi:hypothetical protein